MTETQPLEVELIQLVAAGDMETVETRVRDLNVSQYIQVMRAIQKLEDLMIDASEQWENACYWGRGVPFPDEADEDEQEAEAVERMAA